MKTSLRLELIVKSLFCAKKNCPKVFRANDGSIYVQGYIPHTTVFEIADIPEGESLVKIDQSIIDQIKTL